MQYIGFWKRALAAFIDCLALMVVFAPVFFIGFFFSGYVLYQVITVAISSSYYIYLHSRYGATVGKQVLGIKVVSLDGSPITFEQSLYRYSPYLIYGVINIVTFLTMMPLFAEQEVAMSATDIERMIKEDPPILSTIVNIFFFFFFVGEVISIVASETKRSLHDFIAGTVVVKDLEGQEHF